MSGSSKHRLVMAVVWLSLTVGSALGAWKNDEPLTHGGGPLLGNPVNVRMAWNPVTGRIGLVYLETQPSAQALTYVEWKPGEGVVTLGDDGHERPGRFSRGSGCRRLSACRRPWRQTARATTGQR